MAAGSAAPGQRHGVGAGRTSGSASVSEERSRASSIASLVHRFRNSEPTSPEERGRSSSGVLRANPVDSVLLNAYAFLAESEDAEVGDVCVEDTGSHSVAHSDVYGARATTATAFDHGNVDADAGDVDADDDAVSLLDYDLDRLLAAWKEERRALQHVMADTRAWTASASVIEQPRAATPVPHQHPGTPRGRETEADMVETSLRHDSSSSRDALPPRAPIWHMSSKVDVYPVASSPDVIHPATVKRPAPVQVDRPAGGGGSGGGGGGGSGGDADARLHAVVMRPVPVRAAATPRQQAERDAILHSKGSGTVVDELDQADDLHVSMMSDASRLSADDSVLRFADDPVVQYLLRRVTAIENVIAEREQHA